MSDELEIAWKNNRILETARQEEMKKRDVAEAALAEMTKERDKFKAGYKEACECITAQEKTIDELREERDLYKRANEMKAEYIKRTPADLQSAWEKFKPTATDNFTSFVAGWLAGRSSLMQEIKSRGPDGSLIYEHSWSVVGVRLSNFDPKRSPYHFYFIQNSTQS